MRIRDTIVAAALLSTAMAAFGAREACAQTSLAAPPTPARDGTLGTISTVTMVLGAATVSLMPRVYYSSPESTVGWKARWHFSVLAPAMTLTALTLLVDIPIKDALKSPRPGCGVDQTLYPLSTCASYGSPSTHAFASWGSTGSGLGVFLVDTFKYSGSRFNAGSFVGNVAVPLTLSVITSVGRGVAPGSSFAYESPTSVVAGTLSGFVTGALLGTAYAFLQRPDCGYGNDVLCW